MDDCLFCKIIAGQINTDFIYEDDVCVVFKDINPKAKTHLLILPREHIPSVAHMRDGDEKTIGHLIKCAKTVAEKLELPGYKLQINVGEQGGQEVFHIHIHLLSNYA